MVELYAKSVGYFMFSHCCEVIYYWVLPATTTTKETKSYTVGSVSGKAGEYRYLKFCCLENK